MVRLSVPASVLWSFNLLNIAVFPKLYEKKYFDNEMFGILVVYSLKVLFFSVIHITK